MFPLELSRPAVNLDVEATTGDPKTARVTQLSLEVYYPDGRFEEFWSVIDPEVPIPEDSSAVHGITEEVLRNCCASCKIPQSDHHLNEQCPRFVKPPTFKQIAAHIYEYLKAADFVGFNHRRYDLPLLEEEFRRCEINFEWRSANTIDVFRLWQIVEPRTLTDAVERYGDGETLKGKAHDARNDTGGTMIALRGMLRARPELPKSVQELHELMYPRDPNQIDSERKFVFIEGVPCINFGKFKGKPMKDNIGYLRWILKNDFSAEVKKIALDVVNGKLPEFRDNSAAIGPI